MSGSLGLGDSRSDSRTTSTSDSYGYQGATSGDVSSSVSSGVSGGSSSSQQDVFAEDLYRRLYGGATGAADRVAMQAPELMGAAKQLFSGGSQFLQTLGGNAGTDYMTDRLTSGSGVEDIIASMKTDAGSLFREELNPAITSRAVASGGVGGSRQAIAQGVAQAKVADDFTRNAATLRYQDMQAKDSIAATVANNSIAAANTGLAALPDLLDVMERGQNAELAPYSSLASILGGPTTLNTSESSQFSRNTAESAAEAFSRSFGEQTATQRSNSRSRAHGWDYSGSFSWGGMGGGGE